MNGTKRNVTPVTGDVLLTVESDGQLALAFPEQREFEEEELLIRDGRIFITKDMIEKATSIRRERMSESYVASRNFISSCTNLDGFEMDFFALLLESFSKALTNIPDILRTMKPKTCFLVNLDDFGSPDQRGRTFDKLTAMMGKYIEFKYQFIQPESGRTREQVNRTIIGADIQRVDNGCAMMFSSKLLYLMCYTGKDLDGRPIGRISLPAKRVMQVEGGYVKRLLIHLLQMDSLYGAGCNIEVEKLYDLIGFPVSCRKLAKLNERVLQPLVEAFRTKLDLALEIQFLDRDRKEIGYGKGCVSTGPSNVWKLAFKVSALSSIAPEDMDYLRCWLDRACTFEKFKKLSWEDFLDRTVVEHLVREGHRLEAKAADPNVPNVDLISMRSLFNAEVKKTFEFLQADRRRKDAKTEKA